MGAMGIMDFMEEEEESDGDSGSVDAGGGDDLFGDDAGGDMDGGFGDVADDGMDDGMDDWGGDDGGFGDMGGGGAAATQELENRVEELENEVGDISSSMSTVRSENEQISEKVDDVEENVRKLLEIYEMVTRGVNPFVDDVPNGGMGGDAFDGGAAGGGGDFGLFDDEEEEQADEDLDEDVADAEAESFFDDDFDDIEEADAMDDFEAEDDDMDFEDTNDGDDETGQAGGSTFQELKEEYESGEADWAEGDDGGPEAAAEPEPAPESEPEPTPEPEPASTDVPAETAPEDDGEFEFEGPEQTGETRAAETTMRMRRGTNKPYLERLPSGYLVDLVVMEWLEFLVEEFGAEEAVHTISYYEDIDWIGESVADDLLTFVDGIADVTDVDEEAGSPATLGVDDHIQSLTFMSQLTGDAIEQKVVDHCAQIRGEGHGLQR
ncbi:fla cluster protein flaCE [halophilic archaeon]|nr:fla cluster protein flaCE [halophilic archaeon]